MSEVLSQPQVTVADQPEQKLSGENVYTVLPAAKAPDVANVKAAVGSWIGEQDRLSAEAEVNPPVAVAPSVTIEDPATFTKYDEMNAPVAAAAKPRVEGFSPIQSTLPVYNPAAPKPETLARNLNPDIYDVGPSKAEIGKAFRIQKAISAVQLKKIRQALSS